MVGVGLGVVGQDQAEQGGFAGAIVAEECPAFTLAHGPVDVVQDVCLAVAHSDVLHINERGGFMRSVICIGCGHRIKGRIALVGSLWGGRGRDEVLQGRVVEELCPVPLGGDVAVLHDEQVVDVGRNLVGAGGDEEYLYGVLADEVIDAGGEGGAGLDVQPDEGIIKDEKLGALKEQAGEEDFARFAMREEVNVFLQQGGELEQFGDFVQLFGEALGVGQGRVDFVWRDLDDAARGEEFGYEGDYGHVPCFASGPDGK